MADEKELKRDGVERIKPRPGPQPYESGGTPRPPTPPEPIEGG